MATQHDGRHGAGGSVGADTGGTFTDVVGDDGRTTKVLSTRDDPGRAVREGVQALGGEGRPARLGHGTTVATNALLERRGARVALVTTAGFEDVVEIARQDRPALYDPFADRPEPLVAREDRLGVPGRLDAGGREVTPVDPGRLPPVPAGVEAVAVALLHADLDDAHERAVADRLRAAGHDVTCSSEVSPEVREYERTATTVVNAYLRPACGPYLRALAEVADEVDVMTSAGGLVPVADAADAPVRLLLSGPAGGVAAAADAARAAGFPDAVTFDMGGTSTDVCLVLDGRPAPAGERTVAGLPVRVPSLDIHTIGAGGGSIAWVDDGGALRVGPRSAGATPGPACYGLGGTEPTVTDADLVLGRIPADATFGSLGPLDRAAAAAALDRAGVAAADVVALVDEAMVQAVRAVTVARGVDPRGLALVAFGGAGPLHACAVAEALDLAAVVVPPRAGVLSAVGVLTAPRQVDLVRSWAGPADDGPALAQALAELADEARRRLGDADAEAAVTTALDVRYRGQSHELTVADLSAFEAEHERRNGYALPGRAVEVVALRATATGPRRVVLPPAAPRAAVTGPAVVAEADCTVWVPDGWRGRPTPEGALVLERTGTAPMSTAAGAVAGSAADLPILVARLEGIAEEVQAVLRRGAFSPNIKERADCSSALFTATGELLVQAASIPVHLGSMPASVAAAIAAFDGGRALGPDDQVILNDPFAGGTHLNDVTVVAPCVVDGRLVGWVANRAHHGDLGGAAPGSIPADATEIQQEGLRIPPVRCTPEVRALVIASSRAPGERAGDLDAQLGANALGVARLAAHAADDLDGVLAYGERRMRAALAALPRTTVTATDVLDSAGAAPELQRPVRIAVAVTVDDDGIVVDFTGTDPQQPGNVNAVEAVTASAVAYAVRVATDPTVPADGGALRPVRVVVPPGTVTAARPPAAVGAGNVEVSQRVADVVLRALAQLAPDRVGAASQGTMNNVLLGGDGWAYYETVGGGQGGRPGRPGMSGVHTGMTNTRNTPVEALERAYPLRVLRTRLRRASGGAGAEPGGEGIERDLLLLADATLSLITERRSSRPWGLAGGGPGAPGENWLLPGGDEARAERLPDKCTRRLRAGDVVRMRTPGGGGWGTP